MIIQSLIKRKQGTNVQLGTTTYEFRPNSVDDHVAEVSNKAHAETLLAIEHGFKEYKSAGKTTAADKTAADAAAKAALEYEAAAAAEAEAIAAEAAKAAAQAEAAHAAAEAEAAALAAAGNGLTEWEKSADAEAAAAREAKAGSVQGEPAQAAPVVEAAPVVSEKEALLAEAKALGIKANASWGVGGLKKAITKAKGN